MPIIAVCFVLGVSAHAADCGKVCDPKFWESADRKTIISELQSVDLGSSDWGNFTPLLHTALRGDLEMISVFVDRGADVNYQRLGDGYLHHGYTALMMAKEPEIVAYLLGQGADPNLLNRWNRNAIFYVENIKSLELLLQAGTNPKQIDTSGNSAIFHAWGYKTISTLIELGLDPNHQNHDGETALHVNLSCCSGGLAQAWGWSKLRG